MDSHPGPVQPSNGQFPKNSGQVSESYFFSESTSQRANASMMQPWPASPNMTANKKGKVAMVKTAGLTCSIQNKTSLAGIQMIWSFGSGLNFYH